MFGVIKKLQNFNKIIFTTRQNSNIHRYIDMNQVYFKHKVEDQADKMLISFRMQKQISDTKKLDKVFNFSRSIQEKVEVSINRMKSNIGKELSIKSKKKSKKDTQSSPSEEGNQELSIKLLHNNVEIHDKTFIELLSTFETSEENFRLIIEDEEYTIKYNSPWINLMTLPTSILTGFNVYPSKLEMDFADRHNSEYYWYKGKPHPNINQIEWEERAIGYSFVTIHPDDIGYLIKLKAVPKSKDKTRSGPEVEVISKNEVQAGPGLCPYEYRHLYTEQKLSGHEMRVVSYNILADYYADTEDGRTKLFAYCPQYAIDLDYRKQLLVKEIFGYNADILCLQEVDYKVFDLDLSPFLDEQKMLGVHDKKGTTPEGLATFYRTDRFELVENYGLNIGETIKTNQACQELYNKLQYNNLLVSRLTDRSTSLQIVLLRSKEYPHKLFLIANTHLYFHPNADHIRLLQISFSMLLVDDFMKKFKEKFSTDDISLIFCGDFNSVPECGIFKLMTEGYVPANFIDWKSKKEEVVENVEVSQPYNMQSACGTPEFTNYTPDFKECLDYIFYQTDKFTVSKVVDMPSNDELSAHIAIPSPVFPSDHIAIIAELSMKN